jgi:hypothetical protein
LSIVASVLFFSTYKFSEYLHPKTPEEIASEKKENEYRRLARIDEEKKREIKIEAEKKNCIYQEIAVNSYYICKFYVTQKFKAPSTAEFPNDKYEYHIDAGETVTIKSYVDAQNSFGAMLRANWVCTIKFLDDKNIISIKIIQ